MKLAERTSIVYCTGTLSTELGLVRALLQPVTEHRKVGVNTEQQVQQMLKFTYVNSLVRYIVSLNIMSVIFQCLIYNEVIGEHKSHYLA